VKCYDCVYLIITGLDGWDEFMICYCTKKNAMVEPNKVKECSCFRGVQSAR